MRSRHATFQIHRLMRDRLAEVAMTPDDKLSETGEGTLPE